MCLSGRSQSERLRTVVPAVSELGKAAKSGGRGWGREHRAQDCRQGVCTAKLMQLRC